MSIRWSRCVSLSVVAGLLGGGLLVLLGCGGIHQARESARRSQSRNNLREIGIAVHNYHDENRSFPAGGLFDDEGRGLHGWQTLLLADLDLPTLSRQINLDVPWDDPENARHFQTLIPRYMNPSVNEKHDAQGRALSHYSGNIHVLPRNKPLRIAEVTDGLTYTLFGGEVASDFKPWGHPENVRDPARGINQGGDTFGNPAGGDCQMLMLDGSVRALSKDTDPQVLKALSTPAGREQIPNF